MEKYRRKTAEDLIKLLVPPKPSRRSSGRPVAPAGASVLSYQEGNSKHLSALYDPNCADSYFYQCFSNPLKIGEGSYGIVYKVISKEDGVTYAVKKFKNKINSESQWKKYAREIRNHELIPCHDNIVKLYVAWQEADYIYMQMEWCQETLEHFGVRCFPIPGETLWSILLDVTLGPIKDVTEGDAKYLAPELLLNNCPVTKAADIFSLGICFLELSCNILLPSQGDLWHELREGIFPVEEAKHLTAEFYCLIKSMMHPNFKERPSVNDILHAPSLRKLYEMKTPRPTVSATRGMSSCHLQKKLRTYASCDSITRNEASEVQHDTSYAATGRRPQKKKESSSQEFAVLFEHKLTN
ncbi:membrane-associated tyrosine- and threonine-specific cdc2-inhibitory kinase isoform X5 [Schistocerca americana]|uniref:membrane-associated tyrosine- and threonine-specific cdc2-inhibitory kinase isoform X5 n=1 Tax=Schistocerca americana TaxID=7009 RepID=UPI001F4F2E77|nr:membrane-associated tyrosine- and threonine-specific cdc2-inhibitory kinase isoform X5 [Schistocerca americana]XP_049953274.1 membrane-associated tyrosine- and threonine-specific cdc2-inhibitory kinase isoform X3 [Schistocerca serialis cubense]